MFSLISQYIITNQKCKPKMQRFKQSNNVIVVAKRFTKRLKTQKQNTTCFHWSKNFKMHAMDFGIPKDTYTTIFFYLILKVIQL